MSLVVLRKVYRLPPCSSSLWSWRWIKHFTSSPPEQNGHHSGRGHFQINFLADPVHWCVHAALGGDELMQLSNTPMSPFTNDKATSSIAQRECNNSDIHSKTTINALENVLIEEMKMMCRSQDHALKLIKTCLNLDMFWNFCQILQSPSHGHCLLHSTISSVKAQLKPHHDLHTGYLPQLIKNEIWTNPKRYSCFFY